MSDVTGDGFLDCLVSDATGFLHIYRYEDLFGPQAKETRVAFPAVTLRLAGHPFGLHGPRHEHGRLERLRLFR